ncbi:MAG: hypothetical protein JWP89_2724 [Schlesneria sp.]|nr:hypothetical protein [Schlesneria sp.]
MPESLLDEEESAALAEVLTLVLLKHLNAAFSDSPGGLAKLTPKQASEYIGILPGCLWQWRVSRDEKCPTYIKVGRSVVYQRKHLDEWLATWHVDNSRPANSPHRFKRKIDLLPSDELRTMYIRMMEELEKTDGDNSRTRYELWRWRQRMLEVE